LKNCSKACAASLSLESVCPESQPFIVPAGSTSMRTDGYG